MFQAPCPNCKGNKGSGCSACNHKGFTTVERSQTLQLPPKVQNGTRLNVNGILLHVNVVSDNDEPFEIENQFDLVFTQTITFKESLIGSKFTVPLPTGDVEYTSELIKIHKKYMIKGAGLPPNGNLHIRFKIQYPESGITEEQIEIIKKHF